MTRQTSLAKALLLQTYAVCGEECGMLVFVIGTSQNERRRNGLSLFDFTPDGKFSAGLAY